MLALAPRGTALSQLKALKYCSTFLPGKSPHQWPVIWPQYFCPLGDSCQVRVSSSLTRGSRSLLFRVPAFRARHGCSALGEAGGERAVPQEPHLPSPSSFHPYPSGVLENQRPAVSSSGAGVQSVPPLLIRALQKQERFHNFCLHIWKGRNLTGL